MSQDTSEETLGDIIKGIKKRTLDPATYGYKDVFKFGVIVTILYLAAAPENAAVILVEYFKTPPEVTSRVIEYGVPVLLSLLIAKSLTLAIYGHIPMTLRFFVVVPAAIFGVIFLGFILVLLALVYLSIEFISSAIRFTSIARKFSNFRSKMKGLFVQWSERYVKAFQQLDSWLSKISNRASIGSKTLILNYILWLVFILVFNFMGYFSKNPYLGAFSPQAKKKIWQVSALHYYCQITGSYNVQECDKIKAQRDTEIKTISD